MLTADNWETCDSGAKHDVRPFYPLIRFKEWRLTAAGVDALRFPRQKAA